MSKIILQLLGPPEIYISGNTKITFPTKKAEALLIYLACPAGIPRSREHLSDFLWSRSSGEQSRNSLRQNLTRLRKALGMANEAIQSDAKEIWLLPDQVETDVCTLERLIEQAGQDALLETSDIVRGGFVDGFSINEPPFEDWLNAERLRISDLIVSALTKLVGYYEDNNDYESLTVAARKLLSVDPLQENAHQSLMKALSQLERSEAALLQYKICEDILRKELDIEPSETTRNLRDEIIRLRGVQRHTVMAPAVEKNGFIRALNGKTSKDISAISNLPPQLQGLDLSVPQRPSLVILPFENLTGDDQNSHLAEGIRIDIQAAVIKITGIFLIAVGSANAVGDEEACEAGQKLGVRYVLKGSVRRSGDFLRISAELIEAPAGQAIWTESYDRQLDDGFNVQDEIIEKIITALDVKLLRGEQAAVWHKTLKNRDALELFYRGVQEFFKLQKEPLLRARKYFEIVEEKQPQISTGATWIALCHWFDAFKAWGDNPLKSLELAGQWAEKAVRFDDADGQAHMVLSHVHLMNRRFDDALLIGREAIALRPNCANANGFFANVLHYCGEQADAIEHVTWAIRYSPIYPPFFADILALAYQFDDKYDVAAAVAGESLRLNPNGMTANLILAAASMAQGKDQKAKEASLQIISADPSFSIEKFVKQQPYRNPSDIEKFSGQLRAAGLPN